MVKPDYYVDDKGNTYKEDPNKVKPKGSELRKEAGKAKSKAAVAQEQIDKVKNSKHWASFKAGKYGKAAAITGAVLGLAKTVTDQDDDSILSTGVNMGVGAGLTYGATKGAEWLANNGNKVKSATEYVKDMLPKGKSDNPLKAGKYKVTAGSIGPDISKEETEKILKNRKRVIKAKQGKVKEVRENIKQLVGKKHLHFTVGDYQHEETKVKMKSVIKKQIADKRAKNFAGKMGVMGAIGATVIGVASIMDTQNNMKQEARTERMKGYEEENNIRKQSQRKKSREQASYGYTDMGQIPIDMFNQRIGHYKMGNSKFQ